MSVLHLFENKQSEGSRAQTFTKNSQHEQKPWKKTVFLGVEFFRSSALLEKEMRVFQIERLSTLSLVFNKVVFCRLPRYRVLKTMFFRVFFREKKSLGGPQRESL